MTMGSVAEELTGLPETQCRHHWVIEPPQGATSSGFCKRCGAEREFLNTVSNLLWEGDPMAEARLGHWGRPAISDITTREEADDA